MAKFNIVIATHGRFGEELVKSAEMITGKWKTYRCCLCCRPCLLRTL